MTDFIHIHNHSQYSKFDGFASVSSLVKKAKKLGMPAVGLTDHGTFAGAIDFLKTCRREGIKPILGVESYLAKSHKCHDSGGQPDGRKGNRHLNIIAKNYTGYQNICTLSQAASLDGYYYDPRIDFELLNKHKEGLIVTSACLSNPVNNFLSRDNYVAARTTAATFKDVFGEDYYLEIMYHGLELEAKIIPQIQKLATDLQIKTIITNDCHYVEKEDAEFQKVVMCMSSGRSIKDPKRIDFPFNEFYFKSQEEMRLMFKDLPKSMKNTLEIADKCDYSDIIFIEDGGTMKLPKFDIPPEFDSPHSYLEHLAQQGLKKIGLDKSPVHIERLRQELDDVKLVWDTKRYDFATYFLIVNDIMRFANEKGIAAGIRGSGFGSLLLKCLGISEGVDPVSQGLLWERFLGFDSKYFLSDDDFGLVSCKDKVAQSIETGTDDADASAVMFDRYH